MPRAGGSYIYASRGLNPYLGFVGSFSQWFGLSIVIGVISYIIIPFWRDLALAVNYLDLAAWLEQGYVRILLSLGLLWLLIWVNIRGITAYERTLIPMMFLMFALGGIVIISGFWYDHSDFVVATYAEGLFFDADPNLTFDLKVFLSAGAVLFASFIGFDAIAQAGGEARNPGRSIPLAIGIAIITVGSFYMLFTAAIYHAVPWQFVAQEANQYDITAPGFVGPSADPRMDSLNCGWSGYCIDQ